MSSLTTALTASSVGGSRLSVGATSHASRSLWDPLNSKPYWADFGDRAFQCLALPFGTARVLPFVRQEPIRRNTAHLE
jgi:hypothetical protein